MKWILPSPESDSGAKVLAAMLSTKLNFPLPLAQVLWKKGIKNRAEAAEWFSPGMAGFPSPFLMRNMDAAVSRIRKAIDQKEKIRLYGDYDVDGTTSIALLKLFFDDLAYPVDYYVPDRIEEGYGLSLQGIERAARDEVQLMIVMDCGTKEAEKIRLAQSRGLDLIICDHHTPGAELPPCPAFLNPRQEGCTYPFKELSACGIVLRLIEAFQLSQQRTPDAFSKWGDLVALSIACDLVPLVGENRVLAWHGLKKIRENPLPGIRALMSLSTVSRAWNVEDLVFFLGPRINAAGRLAHATRAVEVLLGEAPALTEAAEKLEVNNSWRKETDNQITSEALSMIEADPLGNQRLSTVLFKESWHKGVIGIVASRLIEKYYRPTIMLTRSGEVWVGSGRSVPGFDLYEALGLCSEHLLQFGGHRYAAGLTLEDKSLQAFRAQFESVVQTNWQPEQRNPLLEIAAEVDFSYLNNEFVRLLDKMGPYGPENREPVFLTRQVQVTNARILQQAHLRLSLKHGNQTFEAIGFNLGERWEQQPCKQIDLAWQPAFNTWKEVTTIQLKIKDFIISD